METIKKIKLLDFKLSKNLWSNLFWVYKTTFHWKWMEFAEHREYIFWDSVKDIDWKVSAKIWDIYIKKYEEERDLNVLFLIDISSSMDFWSQDKTKRDLQEEIFYSLAFSALKNNDSISAFLYDTEIVDYIQASKWVSNVFKILESIKKYKERKKQDKDTIRLFEHINKVNIRKNLIFILTDDTNFKQDNILKILWLENDIILINIFDYFENNLLFDNSNISLNLKNSFLNINLDDNEKIEKYRKLRQEKLKDLEQTLRKSKIGYINIDNTKNLYKELISYFFKIN